jgi:hypothetical protein
VVASKNILKKCEQLKESGYPCIFEAGLTIARGFADLGYEEFNLLTSSKMVSIYSGQTSLLQEDHQGHFFSVPTCDDLIEFILRRNVTIRALDCREGRDWKIIFDFQQQSFELIAVSLLDLMLDTTLTVLKMQNVQTN